MAVLKPNTPRNIVAPSLPHAPDKYDSVFQEQYSSIIRQYFNLVSGAVNRPSPCGYFLSTTTQTNPIANTANLITFNVSGDHIFVDLGSPASRVFVAQTGIYDFHISVQTYKTSGGSDTIDLWLRKNGVDVENSNGRNMLTNTTNTMVMTRIYTVRLEAGDYVEFVWAGADTTVVLQYLAATAPRPATPAAVLNVSLISGDFTHTNLNP
jgi:hypothetical protein